MHLPRILAALLALSASSAAATIEPVVPVEAEGPLDLLLIPPPPELGESPKLPELVPGLPAARTLPDGTVCLPRTLSVAIDSWIRYARNIPDLCQLSLDHQGLAADERLKGALAVGSAQCDAEKVTEQAAIVDQVTSIWDDLEYAAVLLGVLAAGVATGYMAAKI